MQFYSILDHHYHFGWGTHSKIICNFKIIAKVSNWCKAGKVILCYLLHCCCKSSFKLCLVKFIHSLQILAFRNTLRRRRLARRGQISNFRVDIEFFKVTERCTVYATLCHLRIDLWHFSVWSSTWFLILWICIDCLDMNE